ncbi:MAG: flippase-like domain-containing protein [Actinomycetota bacterium]|nr:flippase-like domain-containing protein [Actinomycetota bacterium]
MDAPRRSAWLQWVLRAVPALALLAWSFHLALPRGEDGHVAWSALVDAIEAPPAEATFWVVACFALFGATLAAGALRFHLLMRAARVPSRFGSSLHVFLVAIFFNAVLPGGVVGDAWRVWQGHDRMRMGPTVLGVVTLERILGLQALGIVSLCGAPWVPLGDMPRTVLAGLVAVASGCAFGPFLLLHPVAARAMRAIVERLPARFARVKRVTLEAGDGLIAVRGDPARAAAAIGLSLMCQAIPVVAVWTLAQPLAGEVAAPWFAVVVPFVTLASMLPISLGGTGVRELLFVSLFGRVGMPAVAALTLGLGTGLVNLAWAGVGLVLFLVDDHRDADPPTT